MPSTKPQLKAITDEITFKKLIKIAGIEDRSISKQIDRFIRLAIKDYEDKHGEIKI